MNFSPLATIPSPAQGVWHLGPVPVRAYALCILVGIAVAIVISQRRWKARGGDPVVVIDIATWAVPFGVIGGRIYHVLTSPEAYFGTDGEPVKALYIWQGGLGIWGAVVLGGIGAWIGARRSGVKLPPFADAIAPGIVVAQAIGRWGNWFNNELYGRATDLPWGLEIHRWDSTAGQAYTDGNGDPEVLGVFHPAFLYESIWDLFTALVLILADRRWKLGHGRVFALYVLVYSLGRGWIEALRIDDANRILGQRLNVWTAALVFIGGLAYLIISAWRRPGRETEVMRPAKGAAESAAVDSASSSDSVPSTDSAVSKDGAVSKDSVPSKDSAVSKDSVSSKSSAASTDAPDPSSGSSTDLAEKAASSSFFAEGAGQTGKNSAKTDEKTSPTTDVKAASKDAQPADRSAKTDTTDATTEKPDAGTATPGAKTGTPDAIDVTTSDRKVGTPAPKATGKAKVDKATDDKATDDKATDAPAATAPAATGKDAPATKVKDEKSADVRTVDVKSADDKAKDVPVVKTTDGPADKVSDGTPPTGTTTAAPATKDAGTPADSSGTPATKG